MGNFNATYFQHLQIKFALHLKPYPTLSSHVGVCQEKICLLDFGMFMC